MMFAQANSEHCRHKIFNADFIVDGEPQVKSLFGMIRHTEEVAGAGHRRRLQGQRLGHGGRPDRALAARVAATARRRYAGPRGGRPRPHEGRDAQPPDRDLALPRSRDRCRRRDPRRGRDRAWLGSPRRASRASSSRTCTCPGTDEPWEREVYGAPEHIATPLEIMVDGPIGAAAFNNEFGRPGLGGFFRVYEQTVDGVRRGYHKPIMSAGGLGSISADQTEKVLFPAGSLLVQIGGPGMRIGMGGGAASSMASGANAADLDFNSVQRGNPEMERRAQEVINHCWSLGADNPVLAIHDVGAGGLSNAFPELVDDAGLGARFDLSAVPLEESGLAPKEIWVNESQERYVLAHRARVAGAARVLCRAGALPVWRSSASRPTTRQLCSSAGDSDDDVPIDMPMEVLLGKPPRMTRDATRVSWTGDPLDVSDVDVRDAAYAVLRHPIGREQALPHHHRRPHRRRVHAPRPDGRAVAGAGGRRRGHPGRPRRLRGRGHGLGGADAARLRRRSRLRSDGGRRGVDQPARCSLAVAVGRQAVLQLDGRVRARTARTPRSTTRSRPWRWSCARPWGSRCRSARTPCRCGRSGPTPGPGTRVR